MNQMNRIRQAIISPINGPDNQRKEDSMAQRLGTWTEQENLRYAIFLDFHKKKLSSRRKRRQYRMFDHMAMFIGSRNSTQCRSHHQKIENKFRGIKAIINVVKEESGKAQYKASFKEYKPILAKMQLEQDQGIRQTVNAYVNAQVQTQINWIKDFKDQSKQNHKPETQYPPPQIQHLVDHHVQSSFLNPYYMPMFFPRF